MWIKRTSAWSSIQNMWIKTGSTWSPVRSGYIRVNTSSTGWKRFWFKANLPNITTAPSIRTQNFSGTGTQYDGPVATSPITMDQTLWGKDGTYTNYTSIPTRKFIISDSSDGSFASDNELDDIWNTSSNKLAADEKYLFYTVTVQNGTDPLNSISPVSSPVFIIKSQPYSNSFTITGALEVGNVVTANIDIEYYYYNRPTLSSSYIKWYVGNYIGDTSGTPVQTTSLTDALDSTSSTQYLGSDLLYIDSSYSGKYVTAILVAESSWTRYYGYATSTYQLDYVYAGDGNPVSAPLSFSNIVVKDYNLNSGLDNRGLWPTGTINKYTATLTGYASGTTIRIRYRVYNSNNLTYYKPSTAASSTASASWDSYNSDGSGDGYISDVSISGGTATIIDNLYLDETVFNGGGSYPGNWELHVELSAIKSGGTRVYYVSPYQTYYISKRIDSSVSVSPNPVAVNTNTTISGSFVGFPATPSTNAYPKQYKVTYGDGFNSGWLPVPEWTFGTVNPTFSLTKSYSSGGTKTITVDTIPLGSSATTSVTVSQLYTISFDSKGGSAVSSLTQSSVGASIAKPTDPTRSGYTFNGWSTTDGGTTAVTWPRTPTSNETLYAIWTEALSTPTSLTATNNNGAIRLTFSGGSGSQYDIFYNNSNTRPTDGQAFADYPNVTSPYDPPLTNRDIERWFWVRKSTGTLRSNWYPSDSSVSIRLPLLPPPTPVITNSASTSTSLSWHWTQPTPNSSTQDEATSWDYAITQNTNAPSSWTNITTRPTSTSPLVTSSLSNSTTYYLHVRAKNKDANGNWTYQSGTTGSATVLYTVTFDTNGATGSPSVPSVSQTVAGGQVTLASIGTMSSSGNIFGGWRTATNGGTIHAFGSSYTPSSNITLYAYYGPIPTCAAPSWTSAGNFTRTNTQSEIIWYTDFPTPSGAYTAIQSMQFQISTTQSTTGILIGGDPIATRSFPGFGSYPYSGGGTIWAFKCGKDRSSVNQVNDISFSTSARYARARVRMTGIDGLTYNGTYSGWI